jgi:uracil-DNA glycosylase
MTLLETISVWQEEAVSIQPPSETDRVRAVGGLSGPAFFPEGFGLNDFAMRRSECPTIMAIGHNFGCAEYRRGLENVGREDDKPTWRNLDALLRQSGSRPEQCYRTNWFIGLLPGNKQTGRFLLRPDPRYEEACSSLLLKQIAYFRPVAMLLLGPEVAARAYRIIPALRPWRNAKRWIDIDRSSVGHSVRAVEISGSDLRTNVAALLHPSFSAVNQSRRMKDMYTAFTEAEIVRAVLH